MGEETTGNRSNVCYHIGEETTAQTSPSPKVNGLDLSSPDRGRVRGLAGLTRASPTYHSEVLFKLEGPASRGTEGGVEAGEVLLAAHLDEHVHGTGGKANEVQVPFPPAHGQVLQLQVDVADPSFAIGSVRSQILPDALQVLHFFLFFFCCDILWFKVDQLNQGSANIHTKPRECWGAEEKRMRLQAQGWDIQ